MQRWAACQTCGKNAKRWASAMIRHRLTCRTHCYTSVLSRIRRHRGEKTVLLVEFSGTLWPVTKAEICYVHRWACAKSGARAEAGGGRQLSASSVNADSRPDRRAAPGHRRFPGSPRRWWIGDRSSDRIPRRTLCSSDLRSPGPDWTVQVSPI